MSAKAPYTMVTLKEHFEKLLGAEETARVLAADALHEKLATLCAEVKELRMYRYQAEGMASQKSVNVALFISIMGLMLGALGLVLRLLG